MIKSSDDKINKLQKAFLDMYEEEELPEALKNKYKIISCLSSNEIKSVYVVEESVSHIRYILKRANAQNAELLKNEYNILTAIDKDSLPKAVLCVLEGDNSYLLREYVDGDTLEQKIDKNGPFSIKEAIEAMIKICETILLLHNSNPVLIHRDIKPQNIIVTKDEKYKIIDFDTVRRYKEDEAFDTVFLGTRQTAAPEQFGYKQTSIRTDIYSLGILFLYLLTGQYSTKCTLIDFGASRTYMAQKQLTVILKRRYAPIEQYDSKEKQGPWTDIYALAATLYHCLTGYLPPEATERIHMDELKSFRQLGVMLEPCVENAIYKAMSVKVQDRFKSIIEFRNSILGHVKTATMTAVQGIYLNAKIDITDLLTVGRNVNACQLVYPGTIPGVSNMHFQIRPAQNGQGVEIKDMNSTYGTWVNGGRIPAGSFIRLFDGDMICIGGNQIWRIEY